MANIKFSAFNTETNSANVDFLVGYQGTTMKKIAPGNLAAYPFLIDTKSLYSGFVPSGLSGNPQDNTVLGIDAGASITSANTCTIIGSNAGNLVTTGNRQTIVGHDAGSSITTSGSNTIFGYEAGKGISGSSDRNVVVGDMACRTSAGDDNVAIGSSAGYSWNNAVGDAVAIGSFASSASNGATGMIAIGRKSARTNIWPYHISIGYEAGYSNTSGSSNTNIGYKAGYSTTTGLSNTTLGYNTLGYHNGNNNVAIGTDAMKGSVSFTGTGDGNVAIGFNAGSGSSPTAFSNSILIGRDAASSPIGQSNFIVLGNSSHTTLQIPGIQSGASNGDVLTFNSSAGKLELQAAGGGGATSLNGLSDVSIDLTNDSAYFINIPSGLSGATGNLVIGESAGNALTSGENNIAIGFEALSTLTSGIDTVAIGYRALKACNSTSFTRNVALGYNAAAAVTSSAAGVYIGAEVAQVATSGISNSVIIGNRAMYASTGGADCVVIGRFAGSSASGGQNILIGTSAGRSNTNVGHHSIGYQAGYSQTSGLRNTNMGYQAGYSTTTAGNNTHFGYQAGRYHNTTGNVLIGDSAGGGAAWGLSGGTAIGQNAGLRLEFGDGVVAVGRNAAQGATGSQAARQGSVFIGDYAGSYANSNFNTVVGAFALYGVDNTSNPNKTVAVGYQAAYAVTTGDQNTAVGYNAGKTITTGNNITVIGHQAEPSSATTTNEITLGDANVALLRIPGLGSTDGHVLTYSTSSGGIVLAAAGGGGASDLNGLSDVVVNNTDENAYFINIPASRSGDSGNLSIGKSSLNALTSGDYNTAIGTSALNNLTTSEGATAVGYNAGAASGTNLMSGTTLIGRMAGFGRSGYRNVAIGDSPMGFGSGKTGVNRNTAIGYHALYRIDTNGVDNIAIGHEASQFLTTADGNIAIGDNAARSSTADYHISIGYQAGYSNTNGISNTNIGYEAGYSNTTGGQRTCIGWRAGKSNTGVSNTFIGRSAGSVSSTGASNVVVGANCMAFGAIGTQNVAIGVQAAQSATGNYNAIVGMQAGQYMTSGNNNTLIGFEAGRNVTTAAQNTFLGYQAGDALTTSSDNTFIGGGAGTSANASGTNGKNTGVGRAALSDLSSGLNNTAMGYNSAPSLSSGSNNVMIGYQADVSTGAASNQNSFGYSASCSGDNQVTLGNSSIGTLRCQATSITSVSDERDKTEIEDLGYGLAFIDALQPRQFVWDNRAEIDGDGNEYFSANKGKKDFGFVAQEVKELDNDTLRLVYDENPNRLELSYGKLVPILVKAIQELKEEVEILKSQNN